MITQLILSTKMCRKVGYKLFTSSGNRQQSAGVPPTKKTVPTVTYAWGSVTQQHLWGEQIKSSMHTVVLNSHSGPQESSVQLPLRNRKWRKCCYDWLKLGRSVGSLSPIGRTPEPMIYFFRPLQLISRHFLIIYSAPDELLKRELDYSLEYFATNSSNKK